MLAQKEAEVLKAILQYLRIRGVIHWRMNTGAVRIQNGDSKDRFVKFGHPGMADIIGMVPGTGRMLAIEVKSPTGRPSQIQLDFLALVNEAGGKGFIARSVEDVRSQGI